MPERYVPGDGEELTQEQQAELITRTDNEHTLPEEEKLLRDEHGEPCSCGLYGTDCADHGCLKERCSEEGCCE